MSSESQIPHRPFSKQRKHWAAKQALGKARVRTHKHAHTSVLHPQADNDMSRQQDQGLAISPGLAERRQAGLHPSLMALLPSPRSSSFPFAL